MRIVVFLAFLVTALGLIQWQAPHLLPEQALLARDATGLSDLGRAAQDLVASMGTGNSSLPNWATLGAVLAFAGAVGVAFLRRHNRAVPLNSLRPPLAETEALSLETGNAREYLRAREVLSGLVLPDIKQRGCLALARAHQLDLYWRFVGRNRTSKNGRAYGQEYKRWLATTRTTLKAVAVVPEGRFLTAVPELEAKLSGTDTKVHESLKGFQVRYCGQLADYETAWGLAYAELGRAQPNRDLILISMEKLRRLNRMMVEACADLVGPIEIQVRAVN